MLIYLQTNSFTDFFYVPIKTIVLGIGSLQFPTLNVNCYSVVKNNANPSFLKFFQISELRSTLYTLQSLPTYPACLMTNKKIRIQEKHELLEPTVDIKYKLQRSVNIEHIIIVHTVCCPPPTPTPLSYRWSNSSIHALTVKPRKDHFRPKVKLHDKKCCVKIKRTNYQK